MALGGRFDRCQVLAESVDQLVTTSSLVFCKWQLHESVATICYALYELVDGGWWEDSWCA